MESDLIFSQFMLHEDRIIGDKSVEAEACKGSLQLTKHRMAGRGGGGQRGWRGTAVGCGE